MIEVYAENREEWRKWLDDNHHREKEVTLVYYKKHTKKDSISYRESVEEALCFGWIDGIVRKIDEERYSHRFTPRKPNSNWSDLNIRLVAKLKTENKMTKQGLEAYKIGMNNKAINDENKRMLVEKLHPEFEEALQLNEKANRNFKNLSPSYKKQFVGWINSAKTQKTIQKRIVEAVNLLEENKKVGMK